MRHVCERIALLFVISWGAWAQSSSEDIMFKGFPLGGSIEDFKQRFPDFQCTARSSCFFDAKIHCIPRYRDTSELLSCRKRNTYGAVFPRSVWAYFGDSGLQRVTVSISPTVFEGLERALRERYGPPSMENRETLQNRMGATFENHRSTWVKPSGVLWIAKYAGSTEGGSVTIMSQEEWDKNKQREEQRRQSAPKDL